MKDRIKEMESLQKYFKIFTSLIKSQTLHQDSKHSKAKSSSHKRNKVLKWRSRNKQAALSQRINKMRNK